MDAAGVDHKDWRQVGGIITPVKDQAHCGSCWAHSVVENVESLAIRDKIVGSDFRGSPQELVSCDRTMDNGCNGGSPMFGFYYLGKHGLETEKEYPYTSGGGVRGACKLEPSLGEVETGEIWQFDGETDMKEFVLKSDTEGGPISIAVYAVPWKTYKSGIFPASECEGQLDHAVQAVGLDLRGDTPYWIVRNSWNTNWGEDGFIRLPYGVNACGLDKMATYADVKKPTTLAIEDVKEQGTPLEVCDEVCQVGAKFVLAKCDDACEKYAGPEAKECESKLCPMVDALGENECTIACTKFFGPKTGTEQVIV